ncbi:DUF6641 family protein [Marivita sp.]|uniref:DUF6641 family protein n=1 Tax=Marivita sp. TaxID=2003365 RepID=UPI003F6C6A39
MSHLAKLNLKTVQRNVHKDPVIARREKLVAAIEEQLRVLSAALKGEEYTVKTKRWQQNEAGERVRVEHDKRVRAWFFEQDNGFYVQCRYGSRILNINGKSNAVFVDKLEDVAGVLEAFKLAAESGELDKAVVLATKARSN